MTELHEFIVDINISINQINKIQCPFKRINYLCFLEQSQKDMQNKNIHWLLSCTNLYKSKRDTKREIRKLFTPQ